MTASRSPRISPELRAELVHVPFAEALEVTAFSGKVYEWGCPEGHVYKMPVAKRSQGRGCPYCSNRRVLAGWNDLASKAPHLIVDWDFEANGSISPLQTAPSSRYVAVWRCPEGHMYSMPVVRRVRGLGCTVCSNRSLAVGFNDLLTVSPLIAAELVGEDPQSLIAGGHQKHLWKCDRGHEWEASAKTRLAGNGCPVCSGNRVLPGFNDLATVCPTLAGEWSDRNGLSATQVTVGSGAIVEWVCNSGHRWKTAVHARRRTGCPDCSLNGTSRVERSLYESLLLLWPEAQHRKRRVVDGRRVELDVYAPQAIVEYDGSFFHCTEGAVVRDMSKTSLLLSAGFVVVRVREQNKVALSPLPLRHPNLIQLTHVFGSDIVGLAAKIVAMVEVHGLRQDKN